MTGTPSYKRTNLLVLSFFGVLLIQLFNFSICHYGMDDHDHDHGDDYGYGGGMGGGYGGEDPYGGGNPYGGGMDRAPPAAIAKKLDTVEEIKAFITENQDKPVVIGYFDITTNEKDKEIFDEIVDKDGHHYNFGYSTSKQVLEEQKYDGCAVLVYPPAKFISDKVEKPKARYPSKTLKKESLEKFIYDKSLPLVGLRSFEAEERYRNPKLPVLTVFADVDIEKNFKGYQYLANRIRKVATEYKGKLLFNIADKKDFGYELDDYGLDKLEGKKDIGIGLKSGNTYYHTKKAFSTETITEFVKQYFAGEIVGIEKDISSPPPKSTVGDDDDEDESNGPSYVVKGTDDNFKEEVTNSNADVMVEFYAPWCGHCKHLKPKYEKVAQHFKDDTGVKLVAFDATAGEVPKGYDVQGYPTLYFVPADTKKPKPYEGGREKDDIIAYIKKHRTTKSTPEL